MVFPLSIRDTITALAPASAGGLLSITYTTIVVAYHAFTVPITAPHANSSGQHNRCQTTVFAGCRFTRDGNVASQSRPPSTVTPPKSCRHSPGSGP